MHRGHQLLTAGRSIAVQNLIESLNVLVMLAAYAALWASGAGLPAIMSCFGVLVAVVITALCTGKRKLRLRGHLAASH